MSKHIHKTCVPWGCGAETSPGKEAGDEIQSVTPGGYGRGCGRAPTWGLRLLVSSKEGLNPISGSGVQASAETPSAFVNGVRKDAIADWG